MRRRKYLSEVTGSLTALTGCLSGNPIGQRPSFEERTVSLVEINEQPQEYDLELSIEVVEPAITGKNTAEVKLSIENTGSSESPGIGLEYEGLDRLEPIEPDFSDAPNELILVPTSLEQPDPTDGCWTTKEAGGPWNGSAAQRAKKIGPGATFTQEYRVWDPSPQTPCMPTGKYRFGNRLSQVNEPRPGWMFTLSVEQPG